MWGAIDNILQRKSRCRVDPQLDHGADNIALIASVLLYTPNAFVVSVVWCKGAALNAGVRGSHCQAEGTAVSVSKVTSGNTEVGVVGCWRGARTAAFGRRWPGFGRDRIEVEACVSTYHGTRYTKNRVG